MKWLYNKLKLICFGFICITAAMAIFLAAVSLYECLECWLDKKQIKEYNKQMKDRGCLPLSFYTRACYNMANTLNLYLIEAVYDKSGKHMGQTLKNQNGRPG